MEKVTPELAAMVVGVSFAVTLGVKHDDNDEIMSWPTPL